MRPLGTGMGKNPQVPSVLRLCKSHEQAKALHMVAPRILGPGRGQSPHTFTATHDCVRSPCTGDVGVKRCCIERVDHSLFCAESGTGWWTRRLRSCFPEEPESPL